VGLQPAAQQRGHRARRAGTGAWAGLLNTHFWVDRTTGITAAIYSQTLPFATEAALAMYQAFEEALYASL
jgi:methyl acetate hydrolase